MALHEINLKVVIGAETISGITTPAGEQRIRDMLKHSIATTFHVQTGYEVVDFKMTHKPRRHL